mmetsp:Transcript_62243/g.131566  ORF Transcript_62243/g.131566 Transcript_62243/m.131566 type:complete len:659 (+) Transcript_62243:95-2071(+)
MADPQAELESLRKEREEKVKQIAEKKRQVEELRRKRAQRIAQQESHRGGDQPADEKNKSVDSLVAEILGGGVLEAAAVQKVAQKTIQEDDDGADTNQRRAKLQEEYRLGVVSLEPQEQEVYERSVQTDMTGDIKGASKSDALTVTASAAMTKNKGNVLQQVAKQAEKARLRAVRPDAAEDNKLGMRTIRAGGNEDKKEEEKGPEIQEMSQEERDRITGRPDFKAFFSKATLLVERTLGAQEWDVATDWGSKGTKDSGGDNQEIMKHLEEYVEDKWSKMRPVTDVRTSPHKKELFLAAYGQRSNPSLTDPDGCMLVWNLAMKSRPELTFSSPSPVLCADFHRFDEAVFYGGTYAGGIMLWDARARSGPVLRTPLSAKGHTHPVTALQQVGTQNATNLVTASNDGRLCVWSLAMLNLPQETIDLKNENKNKRDLSIMSLSFPENETNVLYAGAEDGSICQGQLHGSKVGVTEVYDGHDGPVAGLDMHPHQADLNQSGEAFNLDLAVSCSFDWSVKVWMVKQFQQPVLSLDSYEDYVYDVKWHPTHPGVFTAIDGEGHVDLWNLNQSVEFPSVRCENPNSRKLALNRCSWSKDGRRLAVGDSEGSVSIYGVDQSIYHPRTADFVLFNEKVRSFQPIMQRARESAYGDIGRYTPGLRSGGDR